MAVYSSSAYRLGPGSEPFYSAARPAAARHKMEPVWRLAGRPLIKNRLFFFGDYQGTRRSNEHRTSERPNALVRSTCLDPMVPLCDLSEYPEPIFDPATGNQFTNDQIPRDI